MAAAVAEGVELLDITNGQPGLGLDPGAQSDFEGAVRKRIEWSKWQTRARLPASLGRSSVRIAGHENRRLLLLDRDDRRGQANLDRRQDGFRHEPSVARSGDAGLRSACYPHGAGRVRAMRHAR